MKWNPDRPMVPFMGSMMQSYPEHAWRGGGRVAPEWREVPPFEATLTVDRFGRGRSSVLFFWRDELRGNTYPMFASDLFDLLAHTTIEAGRVRARWRAVKKGQNYGIAGERELNELSQDADKG